MESPPYWDATPEYPGSDGGFVDGWVSFEVPSTQYHRMSSDYGEGGYYAVDVDGDGLRDLVSTIKSQYTVYDDGDGPHWQAWLCEGE